MNQHIKKLLRFLAPLYRRLGVNTQQLELLLSTKMTVRNRTTAAMVGRKKTQSLFRQLLSAGIITPIFFIMTLFQGNLMGAMMIYNMISILYVIMIFMSEYPHLLFNKTENQILERLPVSSRTLIASRLTAMLGYLLALILAMNVIPMIIVCFKGGVLAGVLFLFASLLAGCFGTLLANLIYLMVVKYVSAEKFEKVMGYVLIVTVVLMISSYQLINMRILDSHLNFDSEMSPGMYFLPSVWFTALPTLAMFPSSYALSLSLVAVASTALLFIFNLRNLSEGVMHQTTRIMENVSGTEKKHTGRIALILASRLTRNPLQKSGFLVTWRLLDSNMKFKQALMPLLIYMGIMNLLMVYRQLTSINEVDIDSFSGSLFTVLPLYFICWGLLMVFDLMILTDREHLHSIYEHRPIQSPGSFLLGCFQAAFFKYCMPCLILFALPILWIGGIAAIKHILLAGILVFLFCLTYFRLNAFTFPFTRYQMEGAKKQMAWRVILNIVMAFGMILIHACITFIPFGIWVVMCLSLVYGFWYIGKINRVTMAEVQLHRK